MILNTTIVRATRVGMALASALAFQGLQAQNLVPNPSFEQVAEDT